MPKQFRDENLNESGPSDGEKPLKKARFVWELKGKHHLKESHKNSTINNNEEIQQDKTSETNNSADARGGNNIVIEENENKAASSNSHKSECNCCSLQTLLEKTSDDINNELDKISNDINLTMGFPNSKNQEYYLHKWQARQIARGFVDNTVNSLLENWSNSPSQSDEYPNDGQVEQDAILMAIQSHGLQSSSSHLGLAGSNLEQEVLDERNALMDEFTNDNLENVENERLKEQDSEISTIEGNTPNPMNQDSLGMEETMDFLNAAVSVAIQKKGLSYGY